MPRLQVYLTDEQAARVKKDMAAKGYQSITEWARVAFSYFMTPPSKALTPAKPKPAECSEDSCRNPRQRGSFVCMGCYDERVLIYEGQGMTRSDAQGVVDAEDLKAAR